MLVCLQRSGLTNYVDVRSYRCCDLGLQAKPFFHVDPRRARLPGSTRSAASHLGAVHRRQYRKCRGMTKTLRLALVSQQSLG